MPEAAWSLWLDPTTDPSQLHGMLQPTDDVLLRIQPVSRLVNDVRNDGPELMHPVAIEPDDGPLVAAPGLFD